MIACIVLTAFGLWLLIEGAAYAVAPDFMRRMAAFLAGQPSRDIAFAGLGSAIVGVILIFFAAQLV